MQIVSIFVSTVKENTAILSLTPLGQIAECMSREICHIFCCIESDVILKWKAE